MNWILTALLLAVLLAGYLGTLSSALMMFRRASLLNRLEGEGRASDAHWLLDHLDLTMHAVAFFRTAARLCCFALILAEIVNIRAGDDLTWTSLGLAAVISLVVVWLLTTVIANAVARYVGVGLIARSLLVLRLLHYVAYPLTRTVSFIDEAVRRLSGANLREDDELEAELLRSIEDTQREGGLDEGAAELLENVVEFTNTDVGEIMTPRTDIEGIELTDDLATIREFIMKAGHSRIPVYVENLDHIRGILYVKDLMPWLGQDSGDFSLTKILRRPTVIPETKQVRDLLADFQRTGVHIAIVIDEYGGTAGLVTIEDVLEEIVGEIHDEHEPDDEEEPTLRTLDDAHAEVDGRYPIYDLNEQLGLTIPEDDDYDTVGGFVLARLGRVPAVGEVLETERARFKTLAATPTRIKKLGVELLQPVDAGSNGGGGS